MNGDLKTFFIMRHAEKDHQKGFDPPLSTKGRYRAGRLADVFDKQPLDAIYVTRLQRVKQTFEPLAYKKQIPVFEYDPYEIESLLESIFANPQLRNVIIGGHQDTAPITANLLLGANVYGSFLDDEHDNLLMIVSDNHNIRLPLHLAISI